MVFDLRGGVFAGAGVKTVVLFFEKPTPSTSSEQATKKVWFYQLNLARNLGKGNPLNEADLAEFVKLQKTKGDSDNSWSIDVKDITGEGRSLGRSKATEKGATLKNDACMYDLSVKNPNKGGEVALRSPEKILAEMRELDTINTEILSKIKSLI